MSQRYLRLRAAALSTGRIPRDLVPWMIELAAAAEPASVERIAQTPGEQLALKVSDEVSDWLKKRGLNSRTIGAPRRSVERCLKSKNVTVETIADVADALGCDVFIEFAPRPAWGGSGTKPGVSGTKPLPVAAPDVKVEGEVTTDA